MISSASLMVIAKGSLDLEYGTYKDSPENA